MDGMDRSGGREPRSHPKQQDVEDERGAGDRRGWRDRRGAGSRLPPSEEPRAYGFRDFDQQRRSAQDRRLYGLAGCAAGREGRASDAAPDRSAAEAAAPMPQTAASEASAALPDGVMSLTPEVLKALLAKSRH
jgi:hypothetical protein